MSDLRFLGHDLIFVSTKPAAGHPVMQKLSARFHLNGKHNYVQRLIYEHVYQPTAPFRLQQTCRTPGCVNHKHWSLRLVKSERLKVYDDEPPTIQDAPWTIDDVTHLLDRYLMTNPRHPIDEDHDLLFDIPRPLLHKVLETFK
jgi:hypothetical protein